MPNTPRYHNQNSRRQAAYKKRRLTLMLALAVLAIATVGAGVLLLGGDRGGVESSSTVPSEAESRPPAQQGAAEPGVSLPSSNSTPQSSSLPAEPESSGPTAAEKENDWRLVLVNAKNRLDGDYNVELADVSAGYQLDRRIVEDAKAMFAAAKADGYTLQFCSAYRSTERSAILYGNKVSEYKNAGYSAEDAAVEAAKWVAPPGTSEHNTGLATDIVSDDYFNHYAELEHDFEKFDEFTWLYEHCAAYGFVLRYPKDKQDVTGITYEPWHYRYVGREHAARIMEQKICLEEYLQS